MKILFIILFLINISGVFAQELDIQVQPKEPVFNESFDVVFEITSNESEKDLNPAISFDPIGLEIVSKSEPSLSTKTMFINGKMSFEKKLSIKYSMVASSSGYAFLRNIKAVVGEKTLTFKNLNIRVLEKARKPRDIFVQAEIDKDIYYAGESILVRYYLYNAQDIPLSTTDVQRFPKLSKFLKRYHQEKVIPERVNFEGRVYVRRVIYTAQLYAQKPGKYFIDPLILNVAYSDRRSRGFDRFGFGLSLGALKKSSVRSKQITLDIQPLPAEGMPPNFTGLVGKHSFNLKLNKQKFLANEPIELEFKVTGEGALEVYDSPVLLEDQNVEEFETSADLKINQDFSASKVFEYTYLGRGDVKIPARNLEFSYFLPETKSYETQSIDLSAIEVVGFGMNNPSKIIEKKEKGEPSESSTEEINKEKILPKVEFTPIYKGINSFIYYSKHLFLVVGSLLIIFLTLLIWKQYKSLRKRKKSLFDQIYSEGLNYARFFQLIKLLGEEGDMKKTIDATGLPVKIKEYLVELTDVINANYKVENKNRKFEIKKKYFQEIERYIKKVNYEKDHFSEGI